MPPLISTDLKACIPALHHEQGLSIKKICHILNIKNPGLPDTLLPSPAWCHSWCECLTTWPSPHTYEHGSLIYSQATQPATHHIPRWNTGAAPLVPWCKSVTNYTYTCSLTTPVHSQGCFGQGFGVQWTSACDLHESHRRSCAWPGNVDVWWWGARRWENI